jgi:drug/metabolite transporter (DMT)-like permease
VSEHRRSAYIAWLAVCFFWGTTFLAIRVALESLPPLMMAGGRHLIAGMILGSFVKARAVPMPARRSWPGQAMLGILMLGIGNGGVVWAEQWVPSGIAAVMVATIPFWVVGVEAALPSGERLTGRQLAGLLLGFAGILMLVWSDLRPGGLAGRGFIQGAIALQISCVGWALGSAYAKRHVRHDNPIASAALQMLFGGVALLVAATLIGEPPGHFTARTAGAFIYLIVFGSLVGYVSYVYALKYLPVTTVALYAFVNPVIAVVLGALLLSEPFTPRMVVAIAVIFAGMMIVRSVAGATDPAADTRRSSREPA